jgi:hypothetical protein
MTPIGSWSFDMLGALENEPKDKLTAIACLKWFNQLCIVFQQDAAAMFHLFPERKESAFFWWTNVLQTPEFEAFEKEMSAALSNQECPLDASLENVLPGVFTRFQGVDERMSAIQQKLDGIYEQIDLGFNSIRQDQSDFLRESSTIL